jgi:hypothetical protein
VTCRIVDVLFEYNEELLYMFDLPDEPFYLENYEIDNDNRCYFNNMLFPIEHVYNEDCSDSDGDCSDGDCSDGECNDDGDCSDDSDCSDGDCSDGDCSDEFN